MKIIFVNAIDLEPFLIFNGNIYYDKSGYGHYIWYISSESDIKFFAQYFIINPSRSHKLSRINSINRFYSLRSFKAHKQISDSQLNKSWKILQSNYSQCTL